MTHFTGLLDERIAVCEGPIDGVPGALFADEEACIAQAVPRRRQEFAAGRVCARAALQALGHAPVPIVAAPDRVPLWPASLVGSITHTDRRAAAAVARRADGFLSIGIDLEPAEGLPDDLLPEILRPSERSQLDRHAGVDHRLLARVYFSAKEAAFKCQYGVTGAMLEHHDIQIDLDLAQGTFAAAFVRDGEGIGLLPPLGGRFRIASQLIATATALATDGLRR